MEIEIVGGGFSSLDRVLEERLWFEECLWNPYLLIRSRVRRRHMEVAAEFTQV